MMRHGGTINQVSSSEQGAGGVAVRSLIHFLHRFWIPSVILGLGVGVLFGLYGRERAYAESIVLVDADLTVTLLLDKPESLAPETNSESTGVSNHGLRTENEATPSPTHTRTSSPSSSPTILSTENEEWFQVKLLEPSNITRLRLEDGAEWSLDITGKWRYNVTTRSKRRTHQGFLKCLANKHLVLTGDSRSRFQYISLILFLSKQAFPRCNEWQTSVDEANTMCKISDERDWSSWDEYFRETIKTVTTNKSEEICFCYRHANFASYGRTRTREDRFFTLQTRYGAIKVTFLLNFQNFCTLDYSFPPFNQGNRSCSPGTCSTLVNPGLVHDERRIEGIVNCVDTVVEGFSKAPNSPVTHVFATSGWSDTDIGCSLVEFTNKTKVPAWIYGPPFRNGWQGDIPVLPTKHGCNVPYYDRATMTKGLPLLYWDSIHPKTSVNEEFNHKLLDVICGENYP